MWKEFDGNHPLNSDPSSPESKPHEFLTFRQ